MTTPAIAFFTYNRPEKTQEVLESICAQDADKVYIYCDGPKDNEEDRRRVLENRAVVESFPIENKMIVTVEQNKGLSRSIIDGITHAFSYEEQLIIIEDDCLPFPQMLRFMAENLRYWRGREDIFSISAYHFMRTSVEGDLPFDVFFSNRFLPWGWATWKNRWQAVMGELKIKKNPYHTFSSVPDLAGRDLRYHAYAVEKNRVNSWAIPLGLITLKKGYKHVMPRMPLVNNTGMDDSGTNTSSAHNHIIPVTRPPDYSFPLTMCPDEFQDMKLDQGFIDSLDVLLPPDWFKKKVDEEIESTQDQRTTELET